MTRQELIASIEQYQPYNEQEEMDKPLILEWIKNNDNAFLRRKCRGTYDGICLGGK